MEIWKDIVGFEGYYEVSTLGNIKSLGRGNNRNATNGLLTKNTNAYGYHRVNLWKNGKPKMVLVHRIVAETFISNPCNERTVNHINGIKTDNRVDNLEWLSYSDNHKHAYNNGLKVGSWKGKFGAENHTSKPIIQMDLDGNILNTFSGQREAQRITGIPQGKISLVCAGKRRSTYGYKWAFK